MATPGPIPTSKMSWGWQKHSTRWAAGVEKHDLLTLLLILGILVGLTFLVLALM